MEQTIDIDVSGVIRQAVIQTPDRPCRHQGLLIALAGPARQVFDKADCRSVADIVLAAGHVVASIDLPKHGMLATAEEKGLAGMSAAMGRGEDVYADFRMSVSRLIDHVAGHHDIGKGRVVAFGISRGGLSALHAAAGDRRIAACAIDAPVTHLPSLIEFRPLAQNPLVLASSAAALVERVADRPVFVSIGRKDPRVDEKQCAAFYLDLVAAGPGMAHELFTGPGETHGATTFDIDRGYHAAAAFILRHLAQYPRTHS